MRDRVTNNQPSTGRELDEVTEALSSAHARIERREAALRQARDSFRQLVEKSPFGIYAVDADFRLALVGNGAQKVFKNVRPLIGRDFAEAIRAIWPEPFANEVIGRFRHTLETGESYHSPRTVERRGDIDEEQSYDWKIERVTLPDGRLGVVCHFYDLSERLGYETALRESEAYSRSVFEANPDCVKIIGLDGRIEQMNVNGQCAMEIEDFDAIRGEYWPSLWPAEARAEIEAAIAEARAGRTGHFSGFCPTAKGTPKWWDVVVTAVPGADGSPVRLVGSSRDITERKRAEEHAQMLMREVNHRAKNLLAVVQAIARMTAGKSEPRLFAERFGERLASLAASHDLVVKSEWRGVDIGDLVRSQLGHFQDLIGRRIVLDGPPLQITPPAAQAIGMAVHELATNASKYGALSNAEGNVRIAWALDSKAAPPQFAMTWSEQGGPPSSEPTRHGFGHSVIVGMAERSLDAKVSLSLARTGVVWRLQGAAESIVFAEGHMAMPLA